LLEPLRFTVESTLRDPRDDVSDNQNIRVLQQRLIGSFEDVRVAQQNDGIRCLRMGVR
jgi:hypothetical protein